MAALDNDFLDAIERDNEIAATREQIQHLTGSIAKPWNEQQLAKMEYQRKVARIHLARLEAAAHDA